MKSIFVILFVFLFSSCKDQNDYPDCFATNSQKIYDLLVKEFEDRLQEKYGAIKDSDFLYRSYLTDLSKGNIEIAFYYNERIIDILYAFNEEEFVEIWVLPLEDGTFFDDSNVELNPDDFEWSNFYTINPREKFYQCGILNIPEKGIKDFFERSIAIGDISYELLSGAFLEVIQEINIDSKMLKLAIAIKFYYELSLYHSSLEFWEIEKIE